MLLLVGRLLDHKLVFIGLLIILELTLFHCPVGSKDLSFLELFVLELAIKLLAVLVHLLTFTVTLIVEELAVVEEVAAIVLSIAFFYSEKVKLFFLLDLSDTDLL